MNLQSEFAEAIAAPKVIVHGVLFDAVTERLTIDRVLGGIDAGRGGWVVTANLDHLRRMTLGREGYGKLCAGADLIVADGMPLIWGSRIQGTPLPQQVAGSSLVWSLAEAAAKADRSLFLLGGSPGTAERSARILAERYPGLRITGTFCPPIGFDEDEAQMEELIGRLESARPDIVYVALGSPKQERLIARLKGCLPRTWWMGVGISLSFICGDVRRPPKWVRRLGLEWFGRLVQEPGRLWRRYLVEGLPFAAVLLSGALRRRMTDHSMGLMAGKNVGNDRQETDRNVCPPGGNGGQECLSSGIS